MHTEQEFKIQLIHFLVKDVRMCADLKYIQKVLPLMALEKVPASLPYIAGLMNMHGKMIPVIDFALRSGMDREQPFSLDMPVILCKKDQKEIGVIVDSIIELTEFSASELQMKKEFDSRNSPFMAAITQNENSSLLINMDYLFTDELIGDQVTYASHH